MSVPPTPPVVHVRPVEYLVSVWPEAHEACPDAASTSLLVTYRGRGTWAVEEGWSHGDKIVLTCSGEWDLDRRGDPDYRFTLDEALELARQHAATLTIAGHAVTEILREHTGRGCPG
jgi:hypothetical protein